MIKKVRQLIKEWHIALEAEIQHLKKYGSSKFLLQNGRLLSNENSYMYFFETNQSIRIPIGASIRIQWGSMSVAGRVLSSEEKSVIVTIEQYLGDYLSEVYLFHDPWELLENLKERLNEVKQSKKKLARIKRIMDPSGNSKHPIENIKSNVHELMLRSKYNQVTFVWGPPGTGKTFTLARVAANKYFNAKRILVLAHSNQAVDVLMDEISSFLKKKGHFKEGDILRYGTHASRHLLQHCSITTLQLIQSFYPDLAERKEKLTEERRNIKMDLNRSFSKRDSDRLLELEKKLASILEKIRQKETQFVKDAKIVGATLAKAESDSSIFEKEFDIVIVDEVSQAYVPQIAFAATLAKRIIICGDFKQLPPIAVGHHPLVTEWLKTDIFHKSGVTQFGKEGTLHQQLLLLKEQRRMHPDISAFTNKHIYHSLVKDHPSVMKSRQEIVTRNPFPNKASILLDVSLTGEHCINERTSNSRFNLWQILISFQLIYESFLSGTRSLGYITPYKAQSVLMELLLDDIFQIERIEADIISATVHRFQGSERDVMIFDAVDSYPQKRLGLLFTGNESERLINVAITRTKGKFIHVCDTSFINSQIINGKTICKLVDHQQVNRQTVLPKEIGGWIQHQHPRLKWMHARKLDHVINDIQQATNSIVLSFPRKGQVELDLIEALNIRKKSAKLIFISPNQFGQLEVDQWVSATIPFPFILIDQRLLWLGLPLEGANRIHPPYVAARLNSKSVSQYLLAQIPNLNDLE